MKPNWKIVLSLVCLFAACSRPASSLTGEPSATAGMTPTLLSTPLAPTLTVALTLPPTITPTPLNSVPASPMTSTRPLREFRMIDAQTGWGASENQVLRSVDGGQTWQAVNPSEWAADAGIVPQVFGLNDLAAWLLVPDAADFNRGRLFRTQDGGKTWQSNEVPFGGGYAQILDAQQVYFLADRGAAAGSQAVDLYHSSDGGINWTLLAKADSAPPAASALPFGGDKSGVTFRDAEHAWVTGFIPADGVTYIYATGDGGKSWKQVQLKLPSGLDRSQVVVEPPRFFDGKTGVMLARVTGDPSAQIFYLSHDGGETWSMTPAISYIGLVSIVSATDWVVWDGGALHTSRDAGQTWQVIQPNISLDQKIAGLQFINAQQGWALSMEDDSTRLYRTNDGGQTWK